MRKISDPDIEAAVELSQDMTWGEAVAFYGDQLGCSYAAGRHLLIVAVNDYPQSRLAQSVREFRARVREGGRVI